MCGIAGIVTPADLPVGQLARMADALRHRGPDGYGYLTYRPGEAPRLHLNKSMPAYSQERATVGLAHRRLAIFDLSAGSLQPMPNRSGQIWLTYNGEIYNFPEIRRDLEAMGYTFSTTGDTEVLLHAYEAWGPDCVRHFVGMWAFAILDLRRQVVILCRDRFGIKPLFYAKHHGSLYFASEIKGLLAVDTLHPGPNEHVAARFLAAGVTDDSEETFFENILHLPAAAWAEVSLRDPDLSLRMTCYWDLPADTFVGGRSDAIERTRALFFDAIKVHARSDVPVGTCLSGGLDSSAIVCSTDYLRQMEAIPQLTHSAFGYCPRDEEHSERRYMEIVAKATDSALHVVEVTDGQFLENLPGIVRSQDEPFGSASILAQWFVFKNARQNGMTVMLDGQGADETLAGYHTYFSTIALGYLRSGRVQDYLALRSKYAADIGVFPSSHRQLLQAALPSGVRRIARQLQRHLRAEAYFRRTPVAAAFSKEFSERHNGSFTGDDSGELSLRSKLRLDLQQTGLPGLLRFEDRNSMAHSIEARVPFLDHRLVEFLFSLPDDAKVQGLETKHVLREALRGIVPEPVRTRKDKIGFRADPAWTFNYLNLHASDLRRHQTEYEARWFDDAGLAAMIDKGARAGTNEFPLWRMLNTKIWLRQNWGDTP